MVMRIKDEMTKIFSNCQMIASLIILIIIFVIAISAIYIWLLPEFFPGYSTYSILIIGVAIAGVSGGITKFKSCPSSQNFGHKVLSVLCGLFVSVLVAFFSLLIIVYVMGV